MRIGYSLVYPGSRGDRYWQGVLEESGCTAVYTDIAPATQPPFGEHASLGGPSTAFPEREAALARLQAGDVLVVPRLGLLGDSLEDLSEVFRDVERSGAELYAMEEDLRTGDGEDGAKALLQVLQVFARFEEERTGARPAAGGQQRVEEEDTSEEDSQGDGIQDTRHSAETPAELRKAKEYAEMIVDTVSNGLLVLTTELRVEAANQSFYECFQAVPEETIGRKVYELGNGQWDIPWLRRLLEDVLPAQKAFRDYEVTHDFEEIGRRVMRLNARQVDNQQLILLAIQDVTEGQRAEAKRRAGEEQMRLIVENVRDIIFRVDLKGRYTFLSPSWEELMGYSVEESLGMPFEEYTHPDERERARKNFQRHLVGAGTDAQGRFVAEQRLLTADGDMRWMRLSARLIRSEAGEVLGTAGTIADLTDTRRAEAERRARERAEELLAAKTNFLNNMSHELRTPLASILGYAELLEEEGSAEQQMFAVRIAKSGRRLRDTFDSILQLAQLDAQVADFTMRPVSVARVAREAAADHRSSAEAKGLAFFVETPSVPMPKDPPGDGGSEDLDPTRALLNEGALGRVLDNLISNAIKFTETGGRVTVRVVPGGLEEVCLEVADTGIGIGEAFQKEGLFEDFRQESQGTNRTYEGSGLGLAITRRLVEHMDGRIEVTSTKGEGATFTVRFPCVAGNESEAEEPPAKASAEAPGPHSSSAPAVLIVEDNANTLMLAERFLGPAHAVHTAAGMAEALEQARHTAFDVLLIDINLAGQEDGVQLLHRFRALAGSADVPAIAFTAHAMPGEEQALREAGFDGYVSKPFSRQELLEAVATHLDPDERSA